MKTGIKRAREHDLGRNDLVDVKSPQTTISALPHDLLAFILHKASEGEKFSPVLGAVNRAFRRAYNAVLKRRFNILESRFQNQQNEIAILVQNKEAILSDMAPSGMIGMIAVFATIPLFLPFILFRSSVNLQRLLEKKWRLDKWLSRGAIAIGISTDILGDLFNSFSKQEMEDETAFHVRESTLNQINFQHLNSQLLDDYLFRQGNNGSFSPRITRFTRPCLNGIAADAWNKVVNLKLHCLGLKQLPKEIGKLPWLKKLDLQNNELSSLPGEIGNLSELTYLSVFNNRLTALPAEFAQLENLEVLDLGSNLLRLFPEEIAQLPSLNVLYLEDNQLTELPKEIEDALAIVDEDDEIVEATIDEILATQKPQLVDQEAEPSSFKKRKK